MKTLSTNIELGDYVTDVVTGFSGVTTSKHIFLTGCDRWSVQPIPDKKERREGNIQFKGEAQVFDDLQLRIIKINYVRLPKRAIESEKPKHKTTGGIISPDLLKKVYERT